MCSYARSTLVYSPVSDCVKLFQPLVRSFRHLGGGGVGPLASAAAALDVAASPCRGSGDGDDDRDAERD